MKLIDFGEKIKNVKTWLVKIVPQAKASKPEYLIDQLKLRQQLQLVASELLAMRTGKAKTTSKIVHDIFTSDVTDNLKRFRSNPSKKNVASFIEAVRRDIGNETANQFELWLTEIFKENK